MDLLDFDLVFVESGYVKYYCNTQIKKNNLSLIVGKNSLVNLGGVITGGNRFSKIISDDTSKIILFNSYTLWDVNFISKNYYLYLSMIHTLQKTIYLFSKRSHSILYDNCIRRFCNLIINNMNKLQNNIKPISHISQRDIAQLIGMHPVTLNKIIRHLREMGVIGRINYEYIEVFDIETLLQLGKCSSQGADNVSYKFFPTSSQAYKAQ